MWVRVKVIRAVGSDDIMMILGTVCEGRSSPWALLTKNWQIFTFAAHYGTGKHLSGIAEEDYAPMLKKKAAYTAQRKKIALTGVFGLGSLAIAAGCVRYVYVKRLAGIKDQYYELADSLNWCSIENYVAIVCGSAPSFSVLVKTYAPRLFGSYYGDQAYQTYSRSHDQPLQRIVDRFRADDPTITTGSQEAIVPTGGILMKTDLHMEVGPSDPTENHMRRNKYDGGF
ncbi:hypothetical protein N7499_009631 [Penicillium canescens]|uniref:Rhodopsin domain-containing protein n=1 Tax=Penicillium canescens TaxID=5083 RepID=A0AAD6IN72_PENCN|nr:uncharacterized protein N7446_008350 [Penicillium canescens]KAJ6019210.1 hypothetical protein N7522_001277 [Penicillium canescens]KAJ6057450.1 hypothetical protein N7460_000724 [Penicillium canescens]KAJ6058767.1 hypothetical protein N7446_008350 [Penicillium canescens]KAJ6071617.1 hypothetical protein N7499_009631 [Penicillium canescens]KAJ6170298.1 hypothetical protein N7485_007644 [Penicillium canescens]